MTKVKPLPPKDVASLQKWLPQTAIDALSERQDLQAVARDCLILMKSNPCVPSAVVVEIASTGNSAKRGRLVSTASNTTYFTPTDFAVLLVRDSPHLIQRLRSVVPAYRRKEADLLAVSDFPTPTTTAFSRSSLSAAKRLLGTPAAVDALLKLKNTPSSGDARDRVLRSALSRKKLY